MKDLATWAQHSLTGNSKLEHRSKPLKPPAKDMPSSQLVTIPTIPSYHPNNRRSTLLIYAPCLAPEVLEFVTPSQEKKKDRGEQKCPLCLRSAESNGGGRKDEKL